MDPRRQLGQEIERRLRCRPAPGSPRDGSAPRPRGACPACPGARCSPRQRRSRSTGCSGPAPRGRAPRRAPPGRTWRPSTPAPARTLARRPASEPSWITSPLPRARIDGATKYTRLNAAVRFCWRTRSQSAGSRVRRLRFGTLVPLAHTRMSIEPIAVSTPSTIGATAARSLTSAEGDHRASPAAPSAARTSSSRLRSRPTSATRTPASAASATVTARPIPPLAHDQQRCLVLNGRGSPFRRASRRPCSASPGASRSGFAWRIAVRLRLAHRGPASPGDL